MIYKAIDKLPEKIEGINYYFLAGSIDYNSSNPWREKLFNNSDKSIHFFDPTRKDHDKLDTKEMEQHILWELKALEISDRIILNLLPTAKSPISLIELGLYAKSDKLTVVCPDKFYQKRYIKVLSETYNFKLHSSLNQFFFICVNNTQIIFQYEK